MGAHGIQTPPESVSLTGHGRGYRISGWGVWCGSHTQPNGPDRIAPVRQPNSLTTAAAQTASVAAAVQPSRAAHRFRGPMPVIAVKSTFLDHPGDRDRCDRFGGGILRAWRPLSCARRV